MKMRCLVLAALVSASGLPAYAQTPSQFETQATGFANPCLQITPTPETAQAAVTACDKVIVDLNALKSATPDLTGHDLNVYLVVISMAQARIGNAYGKLDGVRSARVCQRMESSWAATSQINTAMSPGYADLIKNLVDTSVSTTTKCRNEFGTPVGAAPLP